MSNREIMEKTFRDMGLIQKKGEHRYRWYIPNCPFGVVIKKNVMYEDPWFMIIEYSRRKRD